MEITWGKKTVKPGLLKGKKASEAIDQAKEGKNSNEANGKKKKTNRKIN